MPETLNLNYYYGNEADQYSFYRIPKILLTDRRYKGISLEAKVLYGLLLDRMGLSARNGWLDDNGRVFLYFTQEEAMTMLDCGKDKATKLFRELEGIGLMERKKQGQGHPARIYVKNFILEPESSAPVQTAENQQSRPLDNAAVKTAEKPQSAPLKTSGQECGISAPNNTEINKTEKSDTDPSIPPPVPSAVSFPAGKRAPRRMGLDEMESYRELILENIDYDILLERNPWDKDLLDGYVELMLEICCSTRESVRICGQEVPTEVVKSRFLKLNSEHIGYVMDSLKSNTAKIGNIKAYTLAALYNAPVTMGQYYTSLVSHDMAHGLLGRLSRPALKNIPIKPKEDFCMEHEINILVVEPGKAPRPARVDYSLETFSQLVGGELAMGCFLPHRVMLLYNEDASRQGLPPNRCNPFVNECMSGTFLLCGLSDGEGFWFLSPAEQEDTRHFNKLKNHISLSNYRFLFEPY